jgi:hypothetical protein
MAYEHITPYVGTCPSNHTHPRIHATQICWQTPYLNRSETRRATTVLARVGSQISIFFFLTVISRAMDQGMSGTEVRRRVSGTGWIFFALDPGEARRKAVLDSARLWVVVRTREC